MAAPADPVAAAIERDEACCQKCEYEGDSEEMVGHYIVPLSAGGSETVDNVATLCQHCGRYAPDEYLEPDAYEQVFEEYLATGVRPEADFAYFGVLATEKLATAYREAGTMGETELGTDELLDSIHTVVDSIRELPAADDRTNPGYYWILFAEFAEYGCIADANPLTEKYTDDELLD